MSFPCITLLPYLLGVGGCTQLCDFHTAVISCIIYIFVPIISFHNHMSKKNRYKTRAKKKGKTKGDKKTKSKKGEKTIKR
jgi:hypothetical protein